MAVRKPLVIVNGQIQQLQSGDSLAQTVDQSQYTNDEVGSIVIGTPVYADAAGGVKKARSDASGTRRVIGLVADTSISASTAGSIATDGVLAATTGQWDAVVTGGSGGLVFNTVYYLDPTTAGKLTTTAPTSVGQYVVEIGIAISTTDLMIRIQKDILL